MGEVKKKMVPVEKVEVHVTVTSTIQDGDERSQQIHEAPGELIYKDGQVYVRYEEELEGIGPIQNTIKIEGQEIRIIRHGGIRMNHLYRLGQTTYSTYHTPHGPFEIQTNTTQINVDSIVSKLNEEGNLTLDYDLCLNQEQVGHFQLQIQCRALS